MCIRDRVFTLTKQISQVIHLLNKLRVGRLLRMSHGIDLKEPQNCYAGYFSRTQVLLGTALVNVRDEYGNYSICSAVLDNEYQVNFITENLVQTLQFKRLKILFL